MLVRQRVALSQRLESQPGIGLLAATVGEGRDFKNGRQLAADFGLVPRQASSGGKRLPGISKRGDGYLRSLLIHGAQSVSPVGIPGLSSCYSGAPLMKWR